MLLSLRRMSLSRWPCLLAAMLHLLASLCHAARHLPRDFAAETANGSPSTANSPTVEYTRGPDMGGGVGGLLYSSRSDGILPSPTLKYALSNGRGDIVAQADQNAVLTWTASYEAYGKRTRETGSNADKQRANSKDEDPTGLLNEGFRYRDLETGVWLSRDPAGFVDGPNLYAYVRQNPWTSFDPDGLALDTILDAINVVHDVGRLVKNGAEMGWGAAATGYHKAVGNSAAADASWNGIGGDWGEFKQAVGDTVIDATATCVPFVPAGLQKATRAGLNAYDKVERVEAGVNAVEKASEGDIVGALKDTASAAGTLPGGKKPKGNSSPTSSAKDTANAAKTPTSTALVPYYPPNNGFAGATTREFLMPGQTIDRFGGSGASRFFSPTGTSEAARALPPGTADQPLRTFEVVKPFEVDAGTAAPWFDQPGGGSQFRTPVPLETLLKRGILREQ